MIGAKKYDVTLHAAINVRVPGMEADTPQEAIQAALAKVDLYSLLERQQPTPEVGFTEYAEEVREALVDLVGDEKHEQSLWYIWRNGNWATAPADPNEELQLLEQQAKALREELGAQPDEAGCSRRWKCPDCAHEIEWTYEEMAEAGNPICTDCDIEMELL